MTRIIDPGKKLSLVSKNGTRITKPLKTLGFAIGYSLPWMGGRGFAFVAQRVIDHEGTMELFLTPSLLDATKAWIGDREEAEAQAEIDGLARVLVERGAELLSEHDLLNLGGGDLERGRELVAKVALMRIAQQPE